MNAPAVEMSDGGKRTTRLPTLLFEIRLRAEFRHVAHTQIGDRGQRRRNAKRRLQLFEIEDADPSNAYRFGPRGEPQILHRANRRVKIDRGVCLAAQTAAFGALAIAGDTYIDRRIENTGEFETVVEFALLALIEFARAAAGRFEIPVNGLAEVSVPNHQEVP